MKTLSLLSLVGMLCLSLQSPAHASSAHDRKNAERKNDERVDQVVIAAAFLAYMQDQSGLYNLLKKNLPMPDSASQPAASLFFTAILPTLKGETVFMENGASLKDDPNQVAFGGSFNNPIKNAGRVNGRNYCIDESGKRGDALVFRSEFTSSRLTICYSDTLSDNVANVADGAEFYKQQMAIAVYALAITNQFTEEAAIDTFKYVVQNFPTLKYDFKKL